MDDPLQDVDLLTLSGDVVSSFRLLTIADLRGFQVDEGDAGRNRRHQRPVGMTKARTRPSTAN